MCHSLWPRGLLHARLPCPSLSPIAHSNSCLLCRRCHPTIYPLSPPSSPALDISQYQNLSSELFFHIRWPKYWSFSFSNSLLINIQDLFPLGLTGLISLQSKGFSRVFSSTTVQKCSPFPMVQLSHPYMTTGKTLGKNLLLLLPSFWWMLVILNFPLFVAASFQFLSPCSYRHLLCVSVPGSKLLSFLFWLCWIFTVVQASLVAEYSLSCLMACGILVP